LILVASLLIGLAIVRVSPLYASLAVATLGLLLVFLFGPLSFLLLLLAVSSIVDTLEQYRVLANTSFSVNAAGIINVGVVLLTIFYFLILKRGRFRVNKSLVLPYALYLLWGAFSLAFSADRNSGVRFFVALANPFAVYLLLSDVVKTKRQAQRCMWIIILATLIPLAVGLYQATAGGRSYAVLGYSYNRINATFAHPATYGMFLIFTVAPLLALYFETKKLETKVLWTALLLLMMISALLTYIRIAWIALLSAVTIILSRKNRFLLAVVLVAVVVLALSVPSLRTRIGSVLTQDTKLTMSQDPSTRFRVLAWNLALELFAQRPILGAGMGSYFPASAQLFSEATSPHNEYLRVLAETGVVGLALFVWVLFAIVRFSQKAYRSLTDPFFRSLALGALGASVAFVVLCVTDNPLVYHSVSIYFWALLALVESGRRIQIAQNPPVQAALSEGD
jgi:O-antigen ligase